MLIEDSKFRTSIAMGVGTGIIYLAFMAPTIWSVDGNAMVEVAMSLVKNHNFRVSPETGALGVDGYYYSKWYPLLSIIAMPLVAIGLGFSQILNLPELYIARFCALLLSPLFIAGTTTLVILLSFRLGSDRKGACIAALSFAFGTIAIAYAREFYPEPLLTLLITLSVYQIFGTSKRSISGASIVAGLAILAKPSGIVLGPLLSAYLFFKKRPFSVVITPLIWTIVFALIYGVYNYIRFGSPISFGQVWMTNASSDLAKPSGIVLGLLLLAYLFFKKRPFSSVITPLIWTIFFVLIYGAYNYIRFGSPISFGQSWMTNTPSQVITIPISSTESKFTLTGLLGQLLSPGRGIIWYSPCVVLGIVGFRYAYKSKFLEASLIIVFSLIFLIVNSGDWWVAGWAWGPRYLLPSFPLLLSLAALLTKRWRLALITLAMIGFLVNAPNLISFYKRYYVNTVEQNVPFEATLWSFDYAPFLQGWTLASEQINDARQHDLKTIFKSIGSDEMRGELTHIVPVWWWMLPIVGIPQWFGALLAMLMTGFGIWLIKIAIFT